MTKGLEDCGRASIGVQGSAESQGHDSIPLLGPEPMRAIVCVDTAWNRVLLLLPDWVSAFELEFGLCRDVFKFCGLHVLHSFNILLISPHVCPTH